MAPLYHLGCGDKHLEGYVNVDVRPTPAVDVVADLNTLELPDGVKAGGFFSHAFFEHLRRDARVPHLAAAREALTDDGFICYLGLPDFEQIAQLYLDRGPGIDGPVFDLFNVYRYTHGHPENVDADGYVGQLHKSLFDTEEINRLLGEAGFPAYVVFSYVFIGEPVALSLGFYATAARRTVHELERECRTFLAPFDGMFLEAQTVAFLAGESRASLQVRVAASPWRRATSRVAHKVAARIARI